MIATQRTRTAQAALAAASLVIVIGALTGCATSSPAASTPVAVAVTVATTAPAADATPAPVVTTPAAVTSGAVLTAAQVKTLPQTVRAYTLPDGSLVATVQGEALPAPVVADITTKAQTAIGGEFGVAGTAEAKATSAALKAAVKAAGVSTGRLIVAVFPVHGYRTASSGLVHFWNTTRFDGNFFDTADQAKADVEQQFAKNPAGVEIVILSK